MCVCRRRSARFLTNNLLFYDWSLCLQKNRFAPFFALLTNSSFSLYFFFSFSFLSRLLARSLSLFTEKRERKRKIFVCRLLHNKQHAHSKIEWWCCIGQHYSDPFIMNSEGKKRKRKCHTCTRYLIGAQFTSRKYSSE